MNFMEAVLLVMLCFFAMLCTLALVEQEMSYIRKCPTEDSEQCIWNAHTMGNLSGRSFIRWENVTYYADNN